MVRVRRGEGGRFSGVPPSERSPSVHLGRDRAEANSGEVCPVGASAAGAAFVRACHLAGGAPSPAH